MYTAWFRCGSGVFGPVVQVVAKLWLQFSCVWDGSDVVQYWLRCSKLFFLNLQGRGPGMCDMVQRWFSCVWHGPDVVQVCVLSSGVGCG